MKRLALLIAIAALYGLIAFGLLNSPINSVAQATDSRENSK